MDIDNQIEVLNFGEESATNLTPIDGPHKRHILHVVCSESDERPPSELPLSQVLDGNEKAVPEIDHMQRPAFVYDAVSSGVVGEIHAQYSQPMTSPPLEFVDHQERADTTFSDHATTAPLNRLLPHTGLEAIDTSIRLISSEKVDIKTLRARERRCDDDEDDTSLSSWKQYLCWGSCLSKKVKPADKKKKLLERLRKFFRRK